MSNCLDPDKKRRLCEMIFVFKSTLRYKSVKVVSEIRVDDNMVSCNKAFQ